MRALDAMRCTRDELISLGCWHADLAGACGIAAIVLSRVLALGGFTARFQMGLFATAPMRTVWYMPHAWVETDEYILDVTATQFEEFACTPVVILSKRDARKHYALRHDRMHFIAARQQRSYEQFYGFSTSELVTNVLRRIAR